MLRKFLFQHPSEGYPEEQAPEDELSLGKISFLGVAGVAIDAGNQRITGLALPTHPTDAVSKAYLDAGGGFTYTRTADVNITAGTAVYYTNAGTVAPASSSSEAAARVIGVAATSASGGEDIQVVRAGRVGGLFFNAVPGTPYYLSVAGTPVTTPNGSRRVLLGYASSDSDLDVHIQDYGPL